MSVLESANVYFSFLFFSNTQTEVKDWQHEMKRIKAEK